MSDQRPSTIDVPAFKRSRDHLRYAFNAALFAFEDVTKATKEYFDTIDPILNQHLSLPDDLPMPTALLAPPHERERERKRKRTPAPDIDPENPPPKRAMTPFFLFLNQNRPRIRLELQARNENASMTKISEEATRQWRALDADEKAKYLDAYQTNLGKYKEKVKEWKEGGSSKMGKAEEVVASSSSASSASVSSVLSSGGDKATTMTQQAPAAAAIEVGQVTPLTEKKQKKHKGDKEKEKDKSYKSRSERRKEKHGHGQGQGQNLEHLATPTPMAKTPLPIPPRLLFDTPKTDRSEKKKRHGEKEKGKTPRSERKEKKKHRGSELWQDAAQVVVEE
ncbi:hypothetical protein KEM56_002429 [Ascosphaera pollenicola]|nr:hypothetical protein KEM56_002429 [Ascosphaera pollenicola]